MGKKLRAKRRKNKRWVRRSADEVFERGPIRVERFGRLVRLSNTASNEQQAALLERAKEANKQVLAKLEAQIAGLQSLVGKYDPVKLMHRAAYMLLPLFMKYRSENEFRADESLYLPTVEYLQYLVARTPANADGVEPSESEWDVLWKQATDALLLTQQHLMARGTRTTPPTEIDELRFLLDMQRLAIRVSRYAMFYPDYLESSLLPYEPWITEQYGVSVPEIIAGLQQIEQHAKSGVAERYQDVIAAQMDFAAKLGAQGYEVGADASPEEVARTQEAFSREDFKGAYSDLAEKCRLAFTPAIFDITDLSSLPKPLLSLFSVRPAEDVLSSLTGPDHDDLSPLSTSVLHYKPFLEVGDRFYYFYHSGFDDRIAEIIEVALFANRPDAIPEFTKRRSDRLEADACRLLTSALRPEFVFRNVFYPNPDQVSGGLAELDILMGADDVLLLVEAKAGRFSKAASRGADKSLAKDLSELIVEGQRQAERAEKYIRSADQVTFFDGTGKNALHTLKHSDYRQIVRVVVTREQLGWVGARIAILSLLDPGLSQASPWHVSLDDLRVVAELFQNNELQFAHFLAQRLKASSELRLRQDDEIEHIALYNKINFYHDLPVEGTDRMSFDASYMRDIDFYFADKAAGENPDLPIQKMLPRVRALINALRISQLPGRFEAAYIILSMSAEGRDEFNRALEQVEAGLVEGRQRTIRVPFTKQSLGISISGVGDDNWGEELARSAAQMEVGKCARWTVVQLRSDAPYAVTRIEKLWPGKLPDAEVAIGKVNIESKTQSLIAERKPGRNDSCPCGSGKKYKKCHGR